MIQEHSHKLLKDPEHNFTVAACDGCGAFCPESRLPGRKGFKAIGDARDLAIGAGWTERTVDRKRGRKLMSFVELICPACARASGKGVEGG